MTSKTFDAKAFVASIKFPAKTFLTVDPEGGYLTVSGFGDLTKAKKVWEKAGASVTTEQLSQVRDLFAPKSSKTAAPVTGLQVWCMKCKCNVSLRNPIIQTAKNGKKMTKGECAQCGGPVYSFKVAPDEPIHGTASLSPDKPMTKEQKVAYVKAHSKKSGKEKADATMMSNIEGMTEKRLDKWIASWKAQEAGVKTSAAKTEVKSKKVAEKSHTNSATPKSGKSGGKFPSITSEEFTKKLIELAPQLEGKDTFVSYAVVVGKTKIAVKRAVEAVTGVSHTDFQSSDARRWLDSIGVKYLSEAK